MTAKPKRAALELVTASDAGENHRLHLATSWEVDAFALDDLLAHIGGGIEIFTDRGDERTAGELRQIAGLLRERRNDWMDKVHRLRAAGR